MADTVRQVDYYYVTVSDAPGEAQGVLSALRDSGRVSMLAFLGFPLGGGRSQLDLVPEDPASLRAAAESAGVTLSDAKRAFLIQGDDRVGAVADVTSKLADAGINATAAAAVAAASGQYRDDPLGGSDGLRRGGRRTRRPVGLVGATLLSSTQEELRMTELASPPTEQRPKVARISHWIGGRAVPGESGRTGPVYNPATGVQTGEVDFASRRGGRRGRRRPRRRRSPPGARLSLAKRAELVFRIRELFARPPRRPRADPHARARQGALRRAGRGRARARGDRVRLRHPAPAQGRHVGAGLDRDRRVLDPPAARRRRRDHAVQLPGDGADVDVGAGDRVRQHVRAQAVREGSVRVDLDGRAARRRPACRTASSTSSTATRSRSTRCSSIRTSRRSASSARRRSRATSTRPGRGTASACRRSAARRTT